MCLLLSLLPNWLLDSLRFRNWRRNGFSRDLRDCLKLAIVKTGAAFDAFGLVNDVDLAYCAVDGFHRAVAGAQCAGHAFCGVNVEVYQWLTGQRGALFSD